MTPILASVIIMVIASCIATFSFIVDEGGIGGESFPIVPICVSIIAGIVNAVAIRNYIGIAMLLIGLATLFIDIIKSSGPLIPPKVEKLYRVSASLILLAYLSNVVLSVLTLIRNAF